MRIGLPPLPVTISLRKRPPDIHQLIDRRFDILNFDLDSIPAARLRRLTVTHGLPGAGSIEPGFRSCDRQEAQGATLPQRSRWVSASERTLIVSAWLGTLRFVTTKCRKAK